MLEACIPCDKIKEMKEAASDDDSPSSSEEECDCDECLAFDTRLFAQPKPRGDCPICFLRLPLKTQVCYQACCGQFICIGCRYCLTRERCPFCNAAVPSSNVELKKQLMARIEKYNDPEAINIVGCSYNSGMYDFEINYDTAVTYWRRGSELNSAQAHFNLGTAYRTGRGVDPIDLNQTIHYYQCAAMEGHELARYQLGTVDYNRGKRGRAMRHYMIAARCGHDDSLKKVKEGYRLGLVTKEDFANTLRCFQAEVNEIKSEQRERAKVAMGL